MNSHRCRFCDLPLDPLARGNARLHAQCKQPWKNHGEKVARLRGLRKSAAERRRYYAANRKRLIEAETARRRAKGAKPRNKLSPWTREKDLAYRRSHYRKTRALADAMKMLLRDMGLTIEQFLGARCATQSIPRRNAGETSKMEAFKSDRQHQRGENRSP